MVRELIAIFLGYQGLIKVKIKCLFILLSFISSDAFSFGFMKAKVPMYSWVHGSSQENIYDNLSTPPTNHGGNYGTMGVASSTNVPGPRWMGAAWRDNDGKFWTFGGKGYAETVSGTHGNLSDMWKYDPSTNQWTWMSGYKTTGNGQVGVLGVEDATVNPGGVFDAIGWSDNNDHFYLWTTNDRLWRYRKSSLQWTWFAGTGTVNRGSLGVPSTGNYPPSRKMGTSCNWTDSSNNLWLFGGIGGSWPAALEGWSDVWRFNPSTNEWTWMSGPSTQFANSVYGTQGVPSTSNYPGLNAGSACWKDKNNQNLIWIFGGTHLNNQTSGSAVRKNDLWTYNMSTNEWTWIGGNPNNVEEAGVYGAIGVEKSTNWPGGRIHSSAWIDKKGDFWVQGGLGRDSANAYGLLNDLWRYRPSTGMWTWMGGSKLRVASGNVGTSNYGALSSTGRSYIMPARERGVSPGSNADDHWVDTSTGARGTLYFFGGVTNNSGAHVWNDMWKIKIDYAP